MVVLYCLMYFVKDSKLSSGLPRKKTWHVQLWLNLCQTNSGEEWLSLIFSWGCVIPLRECTIFPCQSFQPPMCCSQARNWQPSSLAQPLRGIQSVSCDWTDKKSYLPPLTGIWYLTKQYGQAFFPRYFVFSWIKWLSHVVLHFSPHVSGRKERLMFTGITVSTSDNGHWIY